MFETCYHMCHTSQPLRHKGMHWDPWDPQAFNIFMRFALSYIRRLDRTEVLLRI